MSRSQSGKPRRLARGFAPVAVAIAVAVLGVGIAGCSPPDDGSKPGYGGGSNTQPQDLAPEQGVPEATTPGVPAPAPAPQEVTPAPTPPAEPAPQESPPPVEPEGNPDELVVQGTDAIADGLVAFYAQYGDYPDSEQIADGTAVAQVVGSWPTNPFDGEPMHEGTEPGDFTYEEPTRWGANNTLSAYIHGILADGSTYDREVVYDQGQ